jgi:hypothetical protein
VETYAVAHGQPGGINLSSGVPLDGS